MRKIRGLLLSIILLSTISISLLAINQNSVVADTNFEPTPPIPNQNMRWGFNSSTIIAWEFELYINSTQAMAWHLIFNITRIGLLNMSGTVWETQMGLNELYYGIELTPMYYNYATGQLESKIGLEPGVNQPYVSSLINLTDDEFHGYSLWNLPIFIPLNGTEPLFEWCFNHELNNPMSPLVGLNSGDLNTTLTINKDTDNNSILIENSQGSGEYARLVYFDNGTMDYGLFYTTNGGYLPLGSYFKWTRIWDFNEFNIVDDVDWAVNIGSEIYVGRNDNQTRVKIINILNTTSLTWIGYQACQEVRANFSIWVPSGDSGSWVQSASNVTIGRGNELVGMLTDFPYPQTDSMRPLIVTRGSKGMQTGYPFLYFEAILDQADQCIYKTTEYGFKYWNMTANAYVSCDYTPDGIVEFLYYRNLEDSLLGYEDLIIYLLNVTSVPAGKQVLNIDPVMDTDTKVTVNISLSQETVVISSAFDDNPFNETIEDSFFFIDITVTNISNLDTSSGSAIDITIEYNVSLYENVQVWYFNTALHTWEQVLFVDLGGGVLQVNVNHTSVYVLKTTEETGSGIPFSNPLIIIITLGLVGIIAHNLRKRNLYSTI
jgi:hypothetical protein